METLSLTELEEKERRSIEALSDRDSWKHSTSFRLPSDAGAQNSLAKAWAMALDRAGGATLVVQSWGVWPSSENMHVVEIFRRGLGETRSVREVPVHFFPAGEMENCWSMTALCLHNFWDFLLLPPNREFIINISHDECADVCANSDAQFQELRKLMEFFELKEFQVGT